MPVQNGGTCWDGINSLVCACAAGWDGLSCGNDVQECASNPCQHGGSCVDDINRYSCTCAAGYSGLWCETNVDECASLPCAAGATCTDAVNGYTCSSTPAGACPSTAEGVCNARGTCVDGLIMAASLIVDSRLSLAVQ